MAEKDVKEEPKTTKTKATTTKTTKSTSAEAKSEEKAPLDDIQILNERMQAPTGEAS